MIKIQIDYLSPYLARILFSHFSEKEYVTNLNIDLHPFNNCSIQIESSVMQPFFNDLMEIYNV